MKPSTNLVAETRRNIGGTKIAPILGLHPFVTAEDVWAELCGLSEPGPEPPNEAMEWGNLLQDVVGCEWARRHNAIGLRRGKKLLTHPGYEYLIAHPDYVILGKHTGLQVKTTSAYQARQWGPSGSQQMPVHVYCQCLWELIQAQLDPDIQATHWNLAVLIGGQDYREYRIEPRPSLQEKMIGLAVRFWEEHVVPKVSPRDQWLVAGVNDEFEAATGPAAADSMFYAEATPEDEDMASQLREVRGGRLSFEKQELAVKQYFIDRIAGKSGMRGRNWSISFKQDPDKSHTDWQVIAQELLAALTMHLGPEGVASDLPARYWKDAVSKGTRIKRGCRRFLPKFSEEDE